MWVARVSANASSILGARSEIIAIRMILLKSCSI
uniref:Uncharacterized protein n=1 Tax=Anguilla anguilla TaxID=7936 RepID=A0A0E9V584_ANGAN